VARRETEGIEAKEFLKGIEDVISNGAISKGKNGNFALLKDRKMAIVSPKLKGNKIVFLLTAFKTRKK
jgi:hypothetical protein